MADKSTIANPKAPAPDRYLALAGLVTAIIAVLVGWGILPGHSELTQLQPEELADWITRAAALVGTLATVGATWRGRIEAARGER